MHLFGLTIQISAAMGTLTLQPASFEPPSHIPATLDSEKNRFPESQTLHRLLQMNVFIELTDIKLGAF
jgi:hypothetical protein